LAETQWLNTVAAAEQAATMAVAAPATIVDATFLKWMLLVCGRTIALRRVVLPRLASVGTVAAVVARVVLVILRPADAAVVEPVAVVEVVPTSCSRADSFRDVDRSVVIIAGISSKMLAMNAAMPAFKVAFRVVLTVAITSARRANLRPRTKQT
jgi:hypothetical protein